MSKEVLFNGDLLREIFRHLEEGRKVQLLAAALTCKTFAEPALDSLWRTMYSIIPFLKLIPSFVSTFGTPVRAVLRRSLAFGPYSEFPLSVFRRRQAAFLISTIPSPRCESPAVSSRRRCARSTHPKASPHDGSPTSCAAQRGSAALPRPPSPLV